ncbi:MAG: hypothetical protein ACPG4N_05560 [Gammaproteobacteria bacterium]
MIKTMLLSAVILTLGMPAMNSAFAMNEEEAEAKCVAEAEAKNLADDKFDDYVTACIEKLVSE